MHRPSFISARSPLRILLIVLLLAPLAAGPSWAQVAVSPDAGQAGVVQPSGQIPGYEEPPWPDESPLFWTSPDDPEMSLIATATLIDEAGDLQVWHGEAIDAMTGDLIVSLDATITYSDAGALWDVTFERFANRFGFDPIGRSNTVELFEPDPDGGDEIAVPGDITWLMILLAANALTLVLSAGGWKPNGCNKPCSNKWILCCNPHDACYCVGGNEANRKFCDIAFAVCLALAGMPAKSVKAYYRGVRLFGGWFFNYKKKPKGNVAPQPVLPGVR